MSSSDHCTRTRPRLRLFRGLLLLGLALLAGTARAQTNGVIGIYFRGTDLAEPILKRYDPMINFDWGSDSPSPSVPEDQFSVRWTGEVLAQFSEDYTFYTDSDDGVRLWINGKQIINNWTDHGPTEDKGVLRLAAGQRYELVMEYYESGGGALARLSWSSKSTPKAVVPRTSLFPKDVFPPGELDPAKLPADARGLLGKYFRNVEMTGRGAYRLDAAVDFNWAADAPGVRGIPADGFSVRWTGQLQVDKADTYTFYTESDDGVRLWVNGQPLIDNWTDHAMTEDKGTVRLDAGRRYDVVMEFYDGGGDAVARLFWSSPSLGRMIVPKDRLWPRMIEGRRGK